MTETIPQPITPGPALAAPPKRRWLRSLFLGLVILICGMLIVSGVTLVGVQRILLHAVHHPEEAPARITARAQKKLGLSADQAAKVKAILVERQKALQALRRQWQPKVREELKRTRDEVAAVLTPEQATAWRNRAEELERRWLPVLPPQE